MHQCKITSQAHAQRTQPAINHPQHDIHSAQIEITNTDWRIVHLI